MPLRAALYARISPTPETGAGGNFSIASQLHEMRKTALGKGYDLAEELEFADANFTGATLDRPALERLRELVRTKQIDVVIAYSPDRWSRSTVDALILLGELKKAGVALEFVSGKYEDTPEGKLAYSMQNMVSEYEREKFRERSARGRKQKAREGFVHCGAVPYGYRYKGKKDGSRGTLVIHEEEAAVVRRIFDMAIAGRSMYQIRATLNEASVRSARGGLWSRTTVYQALRNSTYKGTIAGPADIVIPCQAIVSEETFHRVAQQLERNRLAKVGRPSSQYLLRGMIWCRKCGKRCTTFTGRNCPTYRCGNIDHRTHARRCHASGINQQRFEAFVWSVIWEILTTPAVLRKVLLDYQAMVESKPQSAPAKGKLERLKRKEERALEILSDPDAPVVYADAKKNLELVRREIALAEAEERRGEVIQMPTPRTLQALCNEVASNEPRTFEDRRAVLEKINATVRYENGEVEIEGRIPLENRSQGRGADNNSSDGQNQKNCYREVPPDNNSFASIPFKIKRRVA